MSRGPIAVHVIHRPPSPDGLVRITCAGDDETRGYKLAYRGTIEQAIECLEVCARRLWLLKTEGKEPEIESDPPKVGRECR